MEIHIADNKATPNAAERIMVSKGSYEYEAEKTPIIKMNAIGDSGLSIADIISDLTFPVMTSIEKIKMGKDSNTAFTNRPS